MKNSISKTGRRQNKMSIHFLVWKKKKKKRKGRCKKGMETRVIAIKKRNKTMRWKGPSRIRTKRGGRNPFKFSGWSSANEGRMKLGHYEFQGDEKWMIPSCGGRERVLRFYRKHGESSFYDEKSTRYFLSRSSLDFRGDKKEKKEKGT